MSETGVGAASAPGPRPLVWTVPNALSALRRRGAHLGRVVDDTGTVLGLVTLEDVLEELVGEIRDAAHHDVSGVDAH